METGTSTKTEVCPQVSPSGPERHSAALLLPDDCDNGPNSIALSQAAGVVKSVDEEMELRAAPLTISFLDLSYEVPLGPNNRVLIHFVHQMLS